MNPLDKVLSNPLSKHAAQLPLPMAGAGPTMGQLAGAAWKHATNPATLGPLAAKGALGAAALVAVPAAKKIFDSIQSRRVYKEMVQLSPELEEARAQNPMMFNASYNALRRINPVFASDPLVAGALLKDMMDPDAGDTGRLRTLMTGVKPVEPPKSSWGVNQKVGPFQINQNI